MRLLILLLIVKMRFVHLLVMAYYFDFNKAIKDNVVYDYEKIYTNDINESIIDICKKVNIVVNEKLFNNYIHPKNKNNTKILNSIL